MFVVDTPFLFPNWMGVRVGCRERPQLSFNDAPKLFNDETGEWDRTNVLFGESVHPESQYGLRAKRSITYIIFSLCKHQERRKELEQPLYSGFVDLIKAFDTLAGSASSNSQPI